MNFSPILFVLALAFVLEPAVCEPSALARSLLAKKSFGLAGGINNVTDRQVSTRTTPDLNTFIVTSIQTATLSQADKQSLFSEYFSLIYRNGAMGDLLKDLFGIISPAPVPPTPPKCSSTFTVPDSGMKELSSDGYPANYPSDQSIDCTYVLTAQSSSTTKLMIRFPEDIVIDSTKASLKIYDGPTTNSPLLLDVKTAGASTLYNLFSGATVTVQFKSEIGAVGKWKFSVTS